MRLKFTDMGRSASRLVSAALLAACMAGVGTASGGVQGNDLDYKQTEERRERQDFEYGWVGILGLAGLLGARKMRRTARHMS